MQTSFQDPFIKLLLNEDTEPRPCFSAIKAIHRPYSSDGTKQTLRLHRFKSFPYHFRCTRQVLDALVLKRIICSRTFKVRKTCQLLYETRQTKNWKAKRENLLLLFTVTLWTCLTHLVGNFSQAQWTKACWQPQIRHSLTSTWNIFGYKRCGVLDTNTKCSRRKESPPKDLLQMASICNIRPSLKPAQKNTTDFELK